MAKATLKTIATVLRRAWKLSEPEIQALLKKHAEIVRFGIQIYSNADYVARQIMAAERQAAF